MLSAVPLTHSSCLKVPTTIMRRWPQACAPVPWAATRPQRPRVAARTLSLSLPPPAEPPNLAFLRVRVSHGVPTGSQAEIYRTDLCYLWGGQGQSGSWLPGKGPGRENVSGREWSLGGVSTISNGTGAHKPFGYTFHPSPWSL